MVWSLFPVNKLPSAVSASYTLDVADDDAPVMLEYLNGNDMAVVECEAHSVADDNVPDEQALEEDELTSFPAVDDDVEDFLASFPVVDDDDPDEPLE